MILWYFEHLWWWSNLGSALNLGAAFISLLWMHSYFSPPDLFWLIGAAPRVPTMLLRLWKHEIEATYHQNARTRKVLKNCAHWNHRHKDFPLKIWLQKHQRLIRWEQAWEHWANTFLESGTKLKLFTEATQGARTFKNVHCMERKRPQVKIPTMRSHLNQGFSSTSFSPLSVFFLLQPPLSSASRSLEARLCYIRAYSS